MTAFRLVMNMTKKKVWSLILALMLLLQMLPVSVGASGAEAVPVSEDTIEAETPAEVTPQQSVTMEEGEILDAEVYNVNSVRGLNAKRPMSDENDIDFDGVSLMLYELNTQTLAYGKNIDQRREPASLTKVMTCMLALEHGDLNDKITVSEEVIGDLGEGSSSGGLSEGEVYTLEELLQCLMVKSANDAACVIAHHIGGSIEEFVAMMNRKAQEIGCTGTKFQNPHGLHDDDHFSTARDMAMILAEALKYPKFEELYSMDSVLISGDDTRDARGFTSTNYLISTAENGNYYDERVIGGKTGFLTPAGRCIVCVAEFADLKYLVVVLGATAFDEEGYALYSNFTTASEMLDYGFSTYAIKNVISMDQEMEVIPVSFGSTSATPAPVTNVSALIPTQYDASQLYVEYDLPDDRLVAPIHVGDNLGTALVYYGDLCIGSTYIVSTGEIEVRSPEAIVTPDPEALEKAEETTSAEESRTGKNLAIFIVAIIGITALILLILIVRASILRAIRRRKRRKLQEQKRLEAQRIAKQRAQQRLRQQAQLRAYTQKQAQQQAYQQAQQQAQEKARQQAFYQAQQRAREVGTQTYTRQYQPPQNGQYTQNAPYQQNRRSAPTMAQQAQARQQRSSRTGTNRR